MPFVTQPPRHTALPLLWDWSEASEPHSDPKGETQNSPLQGRSVKGFEDLFLRESEERERGRGDWLPPVLPDQWWNLKPGYVP